MGEFEIATFGTGCFWCTEEIFRQLKGIRSVVPGYAGGAKENPTYEQVCTGTTGHAESVQIQFDPAEISFDDLLEVFWEVHDPTTLNRQGNDVGTQYRSVIFYHTEEQRRAAEESKSALLKSGKWKDPIVTEIAAFTNFYPAEEYHRNYFQQHPDQSYCRLVIWPKVGKFQSHFSDKLKTA